MPGQRQHAIEVPRPAQPGRSASRCACIHNATPSATTPTAQRPQAAQRDPAKRDLAATRAAAFVLVVVLALVIENIRKNEDEGEDGEDEKDRATGGSGSSQANHQK